MRCHDACQGYVFDRRGGLLDPRGGLFAYNAQTICRGFLSQWGYCSATDEDVVGIGADGVGGGGGGGGGGGYGSLDCRGCHIRTSLYDGKCSHLCQYPDRCSHYVSSDLQCTPNFVNDFIIADCKACKWPIDDKTGLSVAEVAFAVASSPVQNGRR